MAQDDPQKKWPASSQSCHKKFFAVPCAAQFASESPWKLSQGRDSFLTCPEGREGERPLEEKSDEKIEQKWCSPGTSLVQGKSLIPHTHSSWRERLI